MAGPGSSKERHSVRQLADSEPLVGTWFDRTQEYLARRKDCWEHLSPEAYRQRVANMAAEIEEDAGEEKVYPEGQFGPPAQDCHR